MCSTELLSPERKNLLPSLLAAADEPAQRRFLEFFTAQI